MKNEDLDLYGDKFEIIKKEDNCTVYKMKDDTGIGIMKCYKVFKGVYIAYNDFRMESCLLSNPPENDIIEINHCREGRIECEFSNGSYAYLGDGDMSINLRSNRAIASSFTLGYYQGISIVINMKEAEKSIKAFLDDTSIDLYSLSSKVYSKNKILIMRANKSIEHIFSELYTIPNEVRNVYFKLKVLELLVFLSITDVDKQEIKKYFQKNQVETVKEIMKYTTDHIEKHITLNKLSQKFEIGLTSMKNCFREVYGTSIYAFTRNYRIQAAALMLRESKESIAIIASKVGYDNSSKFSTAFKDIMNMTPVEYRNKIV